MLLRSILLSCMLAFLTGCGAHDEIGSLQAGLVPPSDERPSDAPMAAGRAFFDKGSYGMAERQFRAATEANPHSIDAWLGLAASYDRLARFDLAERAYQTVTRLGGETSAVLNNVGYHHLLRGNLNAAREKFEEAKRRDPNNPLIQGNLRMLETWKTAAAAPATPQ